MEMTSYLQAAAGLLVVLGLIALVAFMARRMGYGNSVRRDERRLSVVEGMSLDPKRRVLLIRCDNAEHLVLLGPNSETVLSALPERPTFQVPGLPAAEAETPARTPLSTSGPSKLSNAPAAAPSNWAKRKAPETGRREPQLGPFPRERK